MVKIQKPVVEMSEALKKSKALIQRLDVGQTIIQESMKNGSMQKGYEAIRLFNVLAKDLNDTLENALFIHEQLSTGKTTIINRQGYPVNACESRNDQYVMVDKWTLDSLRALRDFFGEEYIQDLEIVSD